MTIDPSIVKQWVMSITHELLPNVPDPEWTELDDKFYNALVQRAAMWGAEQEQSKHKPTTM